MARSAPVLLITPVFELKFFDHSVIRLIAVGLQRISNMYILKRDSIRPDPWGDQNECEFP
jgi:hypothetical protein